MKRKKHEYAIKIVKRIQKEIKQEKYKRKIEEKIHYYKENQILMKNIKRI